MPLFQCLHRAIIWGITVYVLYGFIQVISTGTSPTVDIDRIQTAIYFAMTGYLFGDLVVRYDGKKT